MTRSSRRRTPTSLSDTQLTANVVTYNVLSSALTNDFKACLPQDLDAGTRLKRVKTKLRSHMQDGAVICLQEVSVAWAGPLHVMFATMGYHFVLDLYGTPFNGFMGVGLAFPTDRYEVLNVDVKKLADTKWWPTAPRPTFVSKVRSTLAKWWRKVWGIPRPEDPWSVSRFRKNGVVWARLKCRTTKKSFCVSTYHMPCLFKVPPVMVIHSSLLMQYAHRMAKDDPYIVAGDMNITPNSMCYNMITQGVVPTDSEEYPIAPPHEPWRPSNPQALQSAYVQARGREPEYTNHAKFNDNPEFIDTLDYIFLSPEWKTDGVVELPRITGKEVPQPTKAEPSDHLLLGCRVRLVDGRKTDGVESAQEVSAKDDDETTAETPQSASTTSMP